MMKNLRLLLLLVVALLAMQVSATAKSNPVHTLQLSKQLKAKTLFYPYRDPAGVTGSKSKGLQGITVDEHQQYYLTYSTGDKTRYGYIYKYSSKGKLLKKSERLTIGHGQAIAYKDGYLYQLADIRGQNRYTLQKINVKTFKVERKWLVPSTIHPNVIAMLDKNTAVGVSKSGNGYDLNKIHLGKGKEADRDWREKVHINGLVGTTPGKEVQGFAYGKGKYYILSNGEYMIVNPDGSQSQKLRLNTDREPEGISITNSGRIVMGFNKLNEIFIEM